MIDTDPDLDRMEARILRRIPYWMLFRGEHGRQAPFIVHAILYGLPVPEGAQKVRYAVRRAFREALTPDELARFDDGFRQLWTEADRRRRSARAIALANA